MTDFKPHTLETAPEDSRRRLSATEQKLGFIPNMLAVMSESPVALEAYQGIQGTFRQEYFKHRGTSVRGAVGKPFQWMQLLCAGLQLVFGKCRGAR